MKALFLVLILFKLISCSGGGGGGSSKAPFVLEFQNVEIYTADTNYSLKASKASGFEFIGLFKNSESCLIDNLVTKVSPGEILDGIELELKNNDADYYYYAIYDELGKTKCHSLAKITHDDIAPENITFNIALTSVQIKSNKDIYHPVVDSIQDESIHYLEFYSDASGLNLIKRYRIEDWNKDVGYIPLEKNQLNTVYFTGTDKTLNQGVIYGPITINHDNTPPTEPVLDSISEDLNYKIHTTPTFSLKGTGDGDTVSIHVYDSFISDTPLNIIPVADFNTGFTFSLATQETNTLYILAIDSFGNKSSSKQLTIHHTSTPSYVYDINQTISPSPLKFIKDVVGTQRVFIRNISAESTYNVPIEINSASYVSSSPVVSVDITQCTPTISPQANCIIEFSHTFTALGPQTIQITVNIHGTNHILNTDIVVENPSEQVLQTEFNDNSVLNFEFGTNKVMDLSSNYIMTNIGLFSLVDSTYKTLTASEVAHVRDALTLNSEIYSVGITNGLSLFSLNTKTTLNIALGAGEDASEIESQQFGDYIAFRVKTVLGKYFLLNYEISSNTVDYQQEFVLPTNLVKTNDGVYFVEMPNTLVKQLPTEEMGNYITAPRSLSSEFLISYSNLLYTAGDNELLSDSVLFNLDMTHLFSDSIPMEQIYNTFNNSQTSGFQYKEGVNYKYHIFSGQYTGEVYSSLSQFTIKNINGDEYQNFIKLRDGTNDHFVLVDFDGVTSKSVSNIGDVKSHYIFGKLFNLSFVSGVNLIAYNTSTNATLSTEAIPNYYDIALGSFDMTATIGSTVYYIGDKYTSTLFETIPDLKGATQITTFYRNYSYYICYINTGDIPIVKKLNLN